MMRISGFPEQPGDQASERTGMMAQPPVPACTARIQSPLVFPATHTDGHADDIAFVHGVHSVQGGVGRRDESPVLVVAYEPMQNQSSMILEKQDGARAQVVVEHRANPNGFAGSNDRVHARSAGRETDGIPLLQEIRDQLCSGRRVAA